MSSPKQQTPRAAKPERKPANAPPKPKSGKTPIKAAYERWLKGEHRGDLAKELKLGMGYGALGRAFRELTGLSWAELKAKRGASKPRTRKATRKAGEGQQKAA